MVSPIAITVLLVITAVNIENVYSRRFNKCSMARELLRHGIPMSELSDWVCIVENESMYDTTAMNTRNTDKSWDWGLFQINDMYWCNPKRDGYKTGNEGNGCNIDCAALKSDDISASVNCAQLIKRAQGFKAWVAWREKCEGRTFDLSDCNLPGYSYGSCSSRRAY